MAEKVARTTLLADVFVLVCLVVEAPVGTVDTSYISDWFMMSSSALTASSLLFFFFTSTAGGYDD